jgi:hypothetical protein
MSTTALKALRQELVKAASSFKDKNFQQYFLRIVEDDFAKFAQGGKMEVDFLQKQQQNLEVLQRQALIQNMYFTDEFAVKR